MLKTLNNIMGCLIALITILPIFIIGILLFGAVILKYTLIIFGFGLVFAIISALIESSPKENEKENIVNKTFNLRSAANNNYKNVIKNLQHKIYVPWFNRLKFKHTLKNKLNFYENRENAIERNFIYYIENEWKSNPNKLVLQYGIFSKNYFTFKKFNNDGFFFLIYLNKMFLQNNYDNFVSDLSKIGFHRYIKGNRYKRNFIYTISDHYEGEETLFEYFYVKNVVNSVLNKVEPIFLKYF